MIPDYTESNFTGIEHGNGIASCPGGRAVPPESAFVFTQAVHIALLQHDRDIVINLFHIL